MVEREEIKQEDRNKERWKDRNEDKDGLFLLKLGPEECRFMGKEVREKRRIFNSARRASSPPPSARISNFVPKNLQSSED